MGIVEVLADFGICKMITEFLWKVGIIAVHSKSNQILGLAFPTLLEEDVYGISVLAVASDCQNKGLGKKLLQTLLAEAKKNGSKSVRLTVNSYSTVSFSLYLSHGFLVGETLPIFTFGSQDSCKDSFIREENEITANSNIKSNFSVRRMIMEDLQTCCALMKKAVGFDRKNDLTAKIKHSEQFENDGINPSLPFVMEQIVEGEFQGKAEKKRIVGFISSLNGDYTLAESEDVFILMIRRLFAAIASAMKDGCYKWSCPEIMVPCNRYPKIIRWLLASGMRIQKNTFLMVKGCYEHTDPSYVYCCGYEY